MEQGFDKEIHSLLRRGRGGATPRRSTEGDGSVAALTHLDADEMNAYAEGALPSSARMAAAAHLADCEECRGIVVGLVRAAGVEAALEKSPATEAPASQTAKAERSSWRERLGALFAPRVLAYVAPLLAVCLVGAVAFVALRSRDGAPELVREVPRDSNTRVGITTYDSKDSNAKSQEVGVGATGEQAPAANTGAPAKDAAPVGGAPAGAASTGPVPVADEKKDAEPTAPEVTARQVAELPVQSRAPAPVQNSPAAGASAAAPPSQPKTEATNNEGAKTVNTTGQLREDVTVVGRAEQSQNRAANTPTNTFEVQSPDGSRAQRRAGSPRNVAPSADVAESEDETSDSAKERDKDRAAKSRRRSIGESIVMGRGRTEDKASAEERSAVGRRFRREGSAWVDVNYKTSMSMTGVRRNTDAFRALVADVPEVGRAAEQLSGEFIIVIRGRAYRVRP